MKGGNEANAVSVVTLKLKRITQSGRELPLFYCEKMERRPVVDKLVYLKLSILTI